MSKAPAAQMMREYDRREAAGDDLCA